MFASDRDLLIFEPNLFRDVGWLGQRLLKGTGSISGTTLTISAFDVGFDAAGIAAGHIVTVDGVAYEVLARLSASQATISRLRAMADDPALPPSAVTGKETFIVSFAPQLAQVHGQVIRMLGIEPQDPVLPGVPGTPTEASITNPEALRTVEALGALFLIYAAASALAGSAGDSSERAEWYRRRFMQERERIAVRLDVDGDGLPDATRRLAMGQWVRG